MAERLVLGVVEAEHDIVVMIAALLEVNRRICDRAYRGSYREDQGGQGKRVNRFTEGGGDIVLIARDGSHGSIHLISFPRLHFSHLFN